MRSKLLLIACYCLFHLGSVAQNISAAIENELYIIDTIEIKDPILIGFIEKGKINNVLVLKERLDYIGKSDTSYINFLCSGNGYLFFQPAEFSCLIDNLLYNYPAIKHSRFYTRLQTYLGNAENDIIYVPDDKNIQKPKKHKGWEYNEIYPRKFLLCLAKGSAINRCYGKDEITIANMDNVYFKVLCPVTWK